MSTSKNYIFDSSESFSPNVEFRFNVSISQDGYASKEDANNAIAKNRYIDKDSNVINSDGCLFEKASVTIPELADFIASGHTICNVFSMNSFGTHFKSEQYFRYAQALFFDIDDADCTLDKMMDSLPYEPSIAYRTFSDGIKGNRYRLVYVFDDFINKANFNEAYDLVSTSLGIDSPALDKLSYCQAYFGTDKTDVRVSDAVYRLSDFDIPETPDDAVIIEGYPVKYHSDLILSENGHYYTFPAPYYEVFRKFRFDKVLRKTVVVKAKDGEGRRKKLFATGMILKAVNPEITEPILRNALERELRLFYDNSEDPILLTGTKSIEEIAVNVMKSKKSVRQSRHPGFKINKLYWKEFLGNDYHPMKAVGLCRKEIRLKDIQQYIDPSKSVKENYQRVKQYVDISERTFRRYQLVSKNDIKIYNNEVIRNIYTFMTKNDTIHCEEIAAETGVSLPTIKRKIKLMKDEGMITNEGTNRNPKWVVS